MRRKYRVRLAGLVLFAGLAAGCTAGQPESSGAAAPAYDSGTAAERAVPGAPGVKPESGSSEPGGDNAAKPAEQINQPGVDRKLVRTATLEISTSEVITSADAARDIAIAAGGYAGQEDIRESSARMTLHVPSDRLDRVVEDLSKGDIGKIQSRNQTAQDVTEQLVDVESRIQTQRVSLERVRALLGRAAEIDEIVKLEAEVTRRESDLESLLKRRETLAGSVAMSTVTLRISRDGAQPVVEEDDDSFLGGLAAGWSAFMSAGGFVLRVIGAVLPFAVVLGVPGVLLYRWWRRRERTGPVEPREVAT
ncbi:MAG: DUF4349 domain-containing protein [Actinomycetota bacterium]|nr:DUF4349 domain-containing protein [Actinomycetota bacterium]